MAGGGNFIGRVISYVANELIVNGLSNRYPTYFPHLISPSFWVLF